MTINRYAGPFVIKTTHPDILREQGPTYSFHFHDPEQAVHWAIFGYKLRIENHMLTEAEIEEIVRKKIVG